MTLQLTRYKTNVDGVDVEGVGGGEDGTRKEEGTLFSSLPLPSPYILALPTCSPSPPPPAFTCTTMHLRVYRCSHTRGHFAATITAPFNNMRTPKFKAQPTNAVFAAVNQLFGGSSQLLTMLSKRFDLIAARSAVVGSWEEPPNI